MEYEKMKMADLARRINAYLKKFENDPEINKKSENFGLQRFYNAGAFYYGGRYVSVWAISYQHKTNLTKSDAIKYLKALDSGIVSGPHWVYHQ